VLFAGIGVKAGDAAHTVEKKAPIYRFKTRMRVHIKKEACMTQDYAVSLHSLANALYIY
jgi:hypothetical protein